MEDKHTINTVISPNHAGTRLDQALARMFNDYSRSTLKQWIIEGKVLIDAKPARPRDIVAGGEEVELCIEHPANDDWQPQAIALDIIHEDDDLMVIDKPAGLVVHPGAGNRDGTLLNALLHHEPSLAALPRAGIVHRLDKDTSGVMVVARSLAAHTRLVDLIQARGIKREYQAIVHGVLTAGGRVDAPIGRHPIHRTRMAVVASGKEAITHYRVIRRFPAHTHIQVRLETGRTHQIRVHMAHLRYPLVGDSLYGGRVRTPPGRNPGLLEALRGFKRQALHASRLSLAHPMTGERCVWSASLPPDLQSLLECLGAKRTTQGDVLGS